MSENYAGESFQNEKQTLLYALLHALGIVNTSVIGPDVSFYQEDIAFSQMKAAGAKFVIVRAGQNNWPDTRFTSNWSAAKAAGIPRGSYWYYDSRYPPEKQAELWVNMMGGDRGELPMWADLEESYGGGYAGPYNWRAFIERVRALAPGKEIGVYTAYGYWSANCPTAERAYFAQYPLWVANYGVTSPRLPPGWSDWLFWQFTSTGNGPLYGVSSKGIDLNYFNGDLASFNARYGGGNGTQPPPVIDPPVEPRQRATVITEGLNVRSGPGTSYEIVNGMTRNDVAFGNLDPEINWFGLTLIWRATLDKIEEVKGWASAYPDYLSIQDIVPDHGEDDMVSVTYDNGVQIYMGRLNGHSDYELKIIPPSAIDKAGMFKPDGCRLVENVIGDKDLAFNFSPFNPPCTPNMGVRVNGIEYQIYDGLSQGSYAPFFWWDESNVLQIDHRKTVWKTLTSALQCWRYLIQNGIKNQNTSSAWNNQEPRRAVGRLPDGSTVLLSVCGRGYRDSLGATLHECADFLLQFGCDYALDGDSGGSVRDALRVDGSIQVFKGTSEDRGVPAGGVIKFKEPIIVGDGEPEPDPEPPAGILPFILDVDGYKPFNGELEPDA